MTAQKRVRQLAAGAPAPLLGDAVEEEESIDRPRVLIVDDDERNLLALKTVVEEVADAVVASSGEEALRQLLKASYGQKSALVRQVSAS